MTTSLYVPMTDAPTVGERGGPTWFAAYAGLAYWNNAGGDWRDADDVSQGTNYYAVSNPIDVQGADTVISVTALVARLMLNNTGIYVHLLSGNCKFASRAHATLRGPRLHVVTTTGSFDPPCIVDTWIDPSTSQPMGEQDSFQFPGILKFDLSGVTGTVTSATLTLAVYLIYSYPSLVAFNYVDAPPLNLTSDGEVVGKVVQGIAATVAQDNELSKHPSVLICDDLVSKEYIRANFVGMAGGSPNLDDNCEIIRWPQYGLSAARLWSVITNQRIASWHHWAEPIGDDPTYNPARAFQRAFGDGYEHLFFRHLLEIGTDVAAGMIEAGMKLSGLAGTYDYTSSGAATLPAPSDTDTWQARLWHTGVTLPGIYHIATYYYGADHSIAENPSAGAVLFTNGYVKAGRVYSLEQEIKLNTFTNGVPNADGVLRVWLAGVLMYERTNLKFRGDPRVRIQSIPWINIYHGGMRMPSAPFHYDIGGLVIATEYIGPPKLLLTKPEGEPVTEPVLTVDADQVVNQMTLADLDALSAKAAAHDQAIIERDQAVNDKQATQAKLDAANAEKAALQTQLTQANSANGSLQSRMDKYVAAARGFAQSILNLQP